MDVSIRIVRVEDFTTLVEADCAVLPSNSWGLWLTPELELLSARNPGFQRAFAAEVEAWNSQHPGVRPPVIAVKTDGKLRGQGYEHVFFGIDDALSDAPVRVYERAFGTANADPAMRTVVIPLYKGCDSDYEYLARVSNLKLVLYAYLQIPGGMQNIRNVIIAVDDHAAERLAYRMTREFHSGERLNQVVRF